MTSSDRWPRPGEIGRFIWRVLGRFFGRNRGFILAGAVGYNALLSVVPLFAVLLIGLSLFLDQEVILRAVGTELDWLLPGQAAFVTSAIEAFMAERAAVGGVGLLVVLFFSSIAFRILEGAFDVIFHHHHDRADRHFLVSALLPYAYVAFVGVSLVAMTIFGAALEALDGASFELLGRIWSIDWYNPWVSRAVGLVALTLLFTSLYMVMPTARIRLRRALIGGALAAVLWEIVRSFLVWYFDNLSLVSVIYGSLATVIIVLLSMEIGAIIVLLGAQTIAEVERAERAGLPWYCEPEVDDGGEVPRAF